MLMKIVKLTQMSETSYQHRNMNNRIHEADSDVAVGQGCNGGNGPETFTAAD